MLLTTSYQLYLYHKQPVTSHHGLLTTVAYQLGPHKKPRYALEGAISNAGRSVSWLKNELNFFGEPKEIGMDFNDSIMYKICACSAN